MRVNDTMKKVVCMTMALLVCGSAVACGKKDGGDRTNPNASKILNIGYFNGGVSVEWLKELEKEYEKLNPDVEISINSELKDEIKNQKLMADIANRNEDVFFTHTINYQEFVNRELLLDISDVVKAPATDGEDTIENRMNANLRSAYNVTKVWASTPWEASTTSTAPSQAAKERLTS